MALAVAAFVAYWPVRGQQFVSFDDDVYVTENPHVLNGVTWEGARWAFTTNHGTHWLPLTWLSHMLDCQVFGQNAGAHKLINVTFHTASALLLFLFWKRATAAVWPSAFVAAVFALHPLRVESVAWVAERKDVLSTFFWMLALWAYVRYAERPGVRRYLWVTACFVLGLMAKPMVVTLPFVLLLLDFWPLGRTSWAPPARGGFSRADPGRVIREKVPLFLLAVAGGMITVWVAHSAGAVVSPRKISVGLRVANAIISYGRYLGKMVWPSDLAALYPFPGAWPVSSIVIVAFLLVCGSVVIIRAADRHPYLVVGWLWYLGTLVPVLGLVQVGVQSMADRFTYIPSIGILICVAWGAADVAAGRMLVRVATAVGAVVVVSACAMATRQQLQYWKDSVTLFERAVTVTGDNFLAQGNLGVALCNQGRIGEGIPHLREAVRLSPNFAYAHEHLGRACFSLGKVDEGIQHLRQAVALDPASATAHNNLGVALLKLGRREEAAVEFAEAVRLRPDYALARTDLGGVLVSLGRADEALPHLREAVRLRPDNADAHDNLGCALAALGRYSEAIARYEQALRRNPNHADAHYNLGVLLAKLGRPAEAREHLDAAAKLDPGMTTARQSLIKKPAGKTP